MVRVGRDHWRSSSPMLCERRDVLEQIAQDYLQVGFDYLQSRRFPNFYRQLCYPQVLPLVQVAPCPVTEDCLAPYSI